MTDETASEVREGTTQYRVFSILKDQEWHCRKHELEKAQSGQIAGGGGIQGLQRGTKSRPGYVLEWKMEYCPQCQRKTKWDRWTGQRAAAATAAAMPRKLVQRILEHYKYVDALELRARSAHELTIDHRFPMLRWGQNELPLAPEMSEVEIERRFQLLKKDDTSNHNQLKSRACENCFKTGNRGTPLGIEFFYAGGPEWPADAPTTGPDAEKHCYGCGWYDLVQWRNALNRRART